MSSISQFTDQLITVRDELFAKVNDDTLPMEVRIAALNEHESIALRLRTAMAAGLKAEVAGLELSIDKVSKARKDLEAVLAKAENSAALIKGVAKFLTVVDKVLDQVKAAAAKLG